jgi:transposase-like protein
MRAASNRIVPLRAWTAAPSRAARRIRRQYQMMVSFQGRSMYLWRAINTEGEVLDLLVQPKRDTAAALWSKCTNSTVAA